MAGHKAGRNTKQFGEVALPSNSSSIFRNNKPEGALFDVLKLSLEKLRRFDLLLS